MSDIRATPRWVVVTHALLPNGSAHRLVGALRQQGRQVGLCAVPMPGGVRTRAEQYLPGKLDPELLIDHQHRVPFWRESLSVIDFLKFARQVRSTGRDPVVLVGCDPLAFLEAIVAFRLGNLDVLSDAMWFVDWSAQRLEGSLSGAAYKGLARMASRHADVVCAISTSAAGAIAGLGRSRHVEEILVLPNLPLSSPDSQLPSWDSRTPGVVYLGGLSPEQGVGLLLSATKVLTDMGFTVDIAGDGSSAAEVADAATRIDGLSFHGMVHDPRELVKIMGRARVGLALYDPEFPQYTFGDSLKMKDYLGAGLRVVTTFPWGIDDGVVSQTSYDVASVVAATLEAMELSPPSDPRRHRLVFEAEQPLLELITRLEAKS